ncbi:MAG: family 16 glycosylhydrolase [Crocinitomicaceae bacterium]|nr:family 16 glycosylhydrolase [Crocinitomicaceae bacterium]
MTKFLFLALFGLTTFASNAQWTLIWSDEFGGDALDQTKWVPETGGWGWGNNELQYYTDGDNLTVAGGALIIEARQEQFGGNSHTSGKIITKDIFEIAYGKIEARIKVPLGQGIWPAFWMLGANIDQVSWPYCGEIDVMEHVNNEMAIHGTAHWHNGGGHTYDGNSAVVNPTNYQVYSIEWNDQEIRWFLNGNQYHYLSIANNTQSTGEFQLPFYLILNLAVGGNWPGYPDASTVFPTQLEIDYVRAYKLDAEASVIENEIAEVSVFPNPAVDQLTVESSLEGNATITGMDGSIISEEVILSGSNNLSIADMAEGMYLLTIQHENGSTSTTRFVKE